MSTLSVHNFSEIDSITCIDLNQYNIMVASPLNQFEIRDLLSLDAPILGNLHISITNIGLYLTIGAIFLLIIN